MHVGPAPALRLELPAGQGLQRYVAALLRTLGAELPAQVLSVKALPGGRPDYEVLLSLVGQRVSARTTEALVAGTTVRLRVTGENRLQLLAPAPPPAGARQAAEAHVEQLLDTALRNALPRQQPLQPALRALRETLMPPAPGANPGPATAPPAAPEGPARIAIEKLFEQLPRLGDLRDPTRLASAIGRSGLFLEHSLARGGATAADAGQSDLKALLLRAAERLRSGTRAGGAAGGTEPLPGDELQGDTTRRLQALLARVQGQQLTNLSAQLGNAGEPPAPARLTLELPFLDGARIESLALAVSRESPAPGRRAAAEPVWSVALDFDLGELGALHVQAWLRDRQLSTVFWAAHEATLGLVQQHVGALREQLAAHDIQLEQPACHHGMPPRAATGHPRALIDVAT